MKTRNILLFIFSILIASCGKNSNNYLEKIKNENLIHQSVQFKILEKAYYIGESDTTYTPFEVSLIKNSKDSLKNGYVWIENTYRPYSLVYNLNKFLLIMPTKHKTRLYPNYDYPFISENDWINEFLNIENFEVLIKDTANKLNIIDTIYNTEKCKKYTIEIQNEENNNKKTLIYIFSSKKHFPVYSKMILKTKENTFINELKFSNIIYDNVVKKELDNKLNKLITENPTVPYNPESTEVILENMLQIGDKAPLIKGIFYESKEKFELQNYIGKNIIILDFWYTHCRPCVKAIPELSKFYSENKNTNLKIFGFNYIDNNKINESNLKSFLSNRNISYDIILTNSSVDNRFKIIGYPSMYVIDLDGKIAYSEVGFSSKNFEKLKSVVSKLLKKDIE